MSTPFSTIPTIVFVGSGNSARTILAESFMKYHCGGRFSVSSAGLTPDREIHPSAIWVLRDLYRIEPARTKPQSIEDVRDLKVDFLITLSEKLPSVGAQFATPPAVVAHWPLPDPTAPKAGQHASDVLVREMFRRTALQINRRVELFCSLPFEKVDRLRLSQLITEIGAPESSPTLTP